MADRKSVMKKVQALMAKTTENGCSEQEAMAAFEKARQIMEDHDLTAADLLFEGEMVITNRRSRQDRDKVGKMYLAAVIASYCDCRVWSEGKDVVFFGLDSDTELANSLLDAVVSFTWRNSLIFTSDLAKKNRGLTPAKAEPQRFSFAIGCAVSISNKLKKLDEERKVKLTGHAKGTALVVAKEAMINEELEKRGMKFSKAKAAAGKALDPIAMSEGKLKGEQFQVPGKTDEEKPASFMITHGINVVSR